MIVSRIAANPRSCLRDAQRHVETVQLVNVIDILWEASMPCYVPDSIMSHLIFVNLNNLWRLVSDLYDHSLIIGALLATVACIVRWPRQKPTTSKIKPRVLEFESSEIRSKPSGMVFMVDARYGRTHFGLQRYGVSDIVQSQGRCTSAREVSFLVCARCSCQDSVYMRNGWDSLSFTRIPQQFRNVCALVASGCNLYVTFELQSNLSGIM